MPLRLLFLNYLKVAVSCQSSLQTKQVTCLSGSQRESRTFEFGLEFEFEFELDFELDFELKIELNAKNKKKIKKRACAVFACGGTTFEAGVHVPKFWEFLLQ